MIAHSDQFGPWAADIPQIERTARLRAMQAIVRLSTGPRGDAVCALLRRAEIDPDAMEPAAVALGRLEPLDYRRVLSSYAAIHRPQPAIRRAPPCR